MLLERGFPTNSAFIPTIESRNPNHTADRKSCNKKWSSLSDEIKWVQSSNHSPVDSLLMLQFILYKFFKIYRNLEIKFIQWLWLKCWVLNLNGGNCCWCPRKTWSGDLLWWWRYLPLLGKSLFWYFLWFFTLFLVLLIHLLPLRDHCFVSSSENTNIRISSF